MRIGVVIPFFQREPGILARALTSVAAQRLPAGTSVEVVVVDDASPTPARPEIDAIAFPDAVRVTLLSQANAGPGAARNAGLDHLGRRGSDAVAFLDSDDIWAPEHLGEAVAAMGPGFDLYFCGVVRPSSPASADDAIPQALARLRRPGEPGVAWLRDDGSLVAVEPERLLAGYLETYLSQTSSVVLSARAARSVRFDPSLRLAGEDYMLWMDLALSGVRAAVSSAVNVTCGTGVNIYYSAFDFEGPAVVQRVGYNLLFWRRVAGKLAAAGHPTEAASERVRRYRRAYSYLFLRALMRGQVPSLGLLGRLMREEPLLLPAMPVRFLSVLPRRAAEAVTW